MAARLTRTTTVPGSISTSVIGDGADLPKRTRSFEKRTGRDAKLHFAVGGADDILARIQGYADAGISKFILRPIGLSDSELIAQTQKLVEEVIPEAVKLEAVTG